MVYFILLAVFTVPFLIWLFSTYTKYAENRDNPKRKAIVFGFLMSITLFGFIDNLFIRLSDSDALLILFIMLIAFSAYMLVIVVKDKKMNS